MECPNCKKDLRINPIAYMNLETYNVGGSVLTASECCGAGFTVRMKITYVSTQYQGEKKEDDWGVELTHKIKVKP